MQLVAPRAVRMAVATEAIICTIHLKVSFLVIIFLVLMVLLVGYRLCKSGKAERNTLFSVGFPSFGGKATGRRT